jgi:hypothetical protein
LFVFVDGEALSILQVNALDLHGYLDPEYSDYPYFALRECPLENVARAAYWLTEGESVKDLQIVTVTFTAIGIATLFPRVLYVQPGGQHTRYRLDGRLEKSCMSSDGYLLYSIATDRVHTVV